MTFFKKLFYELILKKSFGVTVSDQALYLELVEQGDTMVLFTTLIDGSAGFSSIAKDELDQIGDPRLVIDTQTKQVHFACKQDFRNLSPDAFALKMAGFLSEAQGYKTRLYKRLGSVLVPRGTFI